MKSKASSGYFVVVFLWNSFIRKFQFVNTFHRNMLVLIKPSLGKSHMASTIFGQYQKQTHLNPSYQDASVYSKHCLNKTCLQEPDFNSLFAADRAARLSSSFSYPSGGHTGQRLFTIRFLPSSVKKIMSNISNFL